MHAFLVSDDEPTAARARQVLLRAGLECPAANVVPLDMAAYHLMHAKPELVVMVLAGDEARGLTVLEDLRGRTQAHLLVVGPTSDAKLVLRTLRAGADDYVDQEELEAELGSVLARWRAGRATKDEAGRVIAVLAPSGGSGSSTVAANVATVLAKEHGTAALVDLKLPVGDLAALLDLRPTHTLADLCRNVSRIDRSLLEGTLVRHASGVSLLAAPLALADAGYINAEGIRQALAL